MLIHADDVDGPPSEGKARVETFLVGMDILNGERLQWIVDGGKFKASYLAPELKSDGGGSASEEGLLISETVVPGFEFSDHDFLDAEGLQRLVEEEKVEELVWLLRRQERAKLESMEKRE